VLEKGQNQPNSTLLVPALQIAGGESIAERILLWPETAAPKAGFLTIAASARTPPGKTATVYSLSKKPQLDDNRPIQAQKVQSRKLLLRKMSRQANLPTVGSV